MCTCFFFLSVALSQGIYKGCYEDNWDDRDLYEYYWGTTTEMTIEACQSTCRAEGYPYCGLQVSDIKYIFDGGLKMSVKRDV